MKLKVLHSYSTTVIGWLVVVGGAMLPVLRLFTNSTFVDALLFGSTLDRVNAWHQVVVTFVVSCAIAFIGAIGLWVGKGPIQSQDSAANSGGNASAGATGNQPNSAEGK